MLVKNSHGWINSGKQYSYLFIVNLTDMCPIHYGFAEIVIIWTYTDIK